MKTIAAAIALTALAIANERNALLLTADKDVSEPVYRLRHISTAVFSRLRVKIRPATFTPKASHLT